MEKQLSFEKVSDSNQLKLYLDANSRLNHSRYVYQYTTVSALVSMIKSKTLHLSNAKNMNDQLEYQNGSKAIWRDLFFSCFMMEDEESIGMWGMYAQPWRDGVKIAIPRETLRKWVSDTTEIMEVSQATKRLTGRKLTNHEMFRIWISAIAYSNCDGINLKNDKEALRCGGQTNRLLHNATHNAELTGYIKDMAWSYEKEVRVKVSFENWMGFERIAIAMPDYVIDSLVITPSPLFEGNIVERIKNEVSHVVNTNKSKFMGKLSIRSVCDTCNLKRYNNIF